MFTDLESANRIVSNCPISAQQDLLVGQSGSCTTPSFLKVFSEGLCNVSNSACHLLKFFRLNVAEVSWTCIVVHEIVSQKGYLSIVGPQ